MKNKLFYLLLILVSDVFISTAQDIHLSQFSQTPLLLNPASAGIFNGYHRAVINYKNQWVAMGNAFKTTAASFDMPFTRGKGAYIGGGISVFRDKAGDSHFGITQAALSLSGILPMDEHNKVSVGMQVGFAQRSATIDDLQWGSQYTQQGYDPSAPSYEVNTINSFVYGDIGAGVFYEFNNSKGTISGKDIFKVNAGVACFHANQPVQSFFPSSSEHLYRKYVAHVAMRWDIPESKFSFLPSVMYFKQGGSAESYLGTLIRYRLTNGTKVTGFYTESSILLGCHFRLNDSFTPQVYYEIGNYAIGFSYDYTTSYFAEGTKSKGGIEVSVKYTNTKDALRK